MNVCWLVLFFLPWICNNNTKIRLIPDHCRSTQWARNELEKVPMNNVFTSKCIIYNTTKCVFFSWNQFHEKTMDLSKLHFFPDFSLTLRSLHAWPLCHGGLCRWLLNSIWGGFIWMMMMMIKVIIISWIHNIGIKYNCIDGIGGKPGRWHINLQA